MEGIAMAGRAGFKVIGQGVVIGRNEFKPSDGDRTFYSVTVGYMGGQVKFSCSQAQFGMATEGAAVDVSGVLYTDAKGATKVELEQIGAQGSLYQAPAAGRRAA
jgi:hypothetical protein